MTKDAAQSVPPLAGQRIIVLLPAFDDWQSVASLIPLIDRQLASAGAVGRIVVVDDGSTTATGRSDMPEFPLPAVESGTVVTLTRNLGNQRAIAIGLSHIAEHEKADFVVVMDADHEDDPVYISQLLEACVESNGENIIFAERTKRSEGPAFRFLYMIYQFLYKALTGMPISIGNFSAIPFATVRRLTSVNEIWSHFPSGIMRARIPFSSIRTTRGRRLHGESKMNLVPLVIHALSGFSVHGEAVAVRVILGVMFLGAAILAMIAAVVGIRLFTDIALIGWTSQVIGILIILMAQLLITVILMALLVVSQRSQIPAVPAAVYKAFIFDVRPL